MSYLFKVALLCLTSLFWIQHLEAHPLDAGLLEIIESSANHYDVKLELHPASVAILEKNLGRLDSAVLYSLPPTCDSSPVAVGNPNGNVTEIKTSLTCAALTHIDAKFLAALDANFKLVVRVKTAHAEFIRTLDPRASRADWTVDAIQTMSAKTFVLMGMEHIGVTPNQWISESGHLRLPEGIDHILFVLILILSAVRLKSLVKLITGFTIGHSLALLLGTYQIVPIASAWAEVGIALSIFYIAILCALKIPLRHGIGLTLAFGFLHGLGFAGALLELHLPQSDIPSALFFFNGGIEIAQLMIVALMWPLLRISVTRPRVTAVFVRSFSSFVTLAAGYWFVERLWSAI